MSKPTIFNEVIFEEGGQAGCIAQSTGEENPVGDSQFLSFLLRKSFQKKNQLLQFFLEGLV